ncbi:MAG: hypothetical protein LAO76_23150 [Acidobacteriia bacterium]|nr:hypothetical protein [Terriglobia bacterium]
MLVIIFHLLIGLLGLVLLYMAFFLTETAEGGLQNRLEELWIRVDDLSRTALSRQAAFLQQIAKLLSHTFDWIFGKKLLSAKAAVTSISLSSAAVFLFWSFIHFHKGPGTALMGLAIAILLLILGLAPGRIRYLGFAWTALLISAPLTTKSGQIIDKLLPVLAILFGGVGSDIVFIAASRWYLRKSEGVSSAWLIILLLGFNITAALLLLGPALVLYWGAGSGPVSSFELSIFIVSISNLITVMIPLLFILLAVAAGGHIVFWPAIQGPIYSAQRYGLVHKPKLLGTIGTICVLFAWPNNPLVQLIAKLFHVE